MTCSCRLQSPSWSVAHACVGAVQERYCAPLGVEADRQIGVAVAVEVGRGHERRVVEAEVGHCSEGSTAISEHHGQSVAAPAPVGSRADHVQLPVTVQIDKGIGNQLAV